MIHHSVIFIDGNNSAMHTAPRIQVKPNQNTQSALWKRDGPHRAFSSSLGGKRYESKRGVPEHKVLKVLRTYPPADFKTLAIRSRNL